jgi:hypothetical protein
MRYALFNSSIIKSLAVCPWLNPYFSDFFLSGILYFNGILTLISKVGATVFSGLFLFFILHFYIGIPIKNYSVAVLSYSSFKLVSFSYVHEHPRIK